MCKEFVGILFIYIGQCDILDNYIYKRLQFKLGKDYYKSLGGVSILY